jgi:hypothetical protein
MPSLVRGAKVQIENYQVKGDEWLTSPGFAELVVSGRRIESHKAEQAAPEPPATRPLSK